MFQAVIRLTREGNRENSHPSVPPMIQITRCGTQLITATTIKATIATEERSVLLSETRAMDHSETPQVSVCSSLRAVSYAKRVWLCRIAAQRTVVRPGEFIPGDPPGLLLTQFEGLALCGTWEVNVADHAGQDSGFLSNWCLDPGAPDGNGSGDVPSTTIVGVFAMLLLLLGLSAPGSWAPSPHRRRRPDRSRGPSERHPSRR